MYAEYELGDELIVMGDTIPDEVMVAIGDLPTL